MGKMGLGSLGLCGSTLSVVLAVLLTQTACEKKRDGSSAKKPDQAAGLHELIPVQEIETWKHSIQTTGDAPEFSTVTEAEDLRIAPDVEDMNVQGVVKFNSDDPLLQKQTRAIALMGKPNTTYTLSYRLTPKYLKIFKRVPAKEISHYEVPYSQRENADYLVPLGGYPITYYDNDEPSSRQDSGSKSWRTARYFRIDWANFHAFERLVKKDVYPMSYFTEGKWYFSKAVVSTKPGDEQSEGLGMTDSAVSSGFQLANKLAFRPLKKYLRGVNVAVADLKKRFEKKKGDSQDDVIAFRVDWKDFVAEPGDDEFDELREKEDTSRRDEYRKFGQFDFVQTSMFTGGKTIFDYVRGQIISASRLEELHFDKDGFSFTLVEVASGIRTRFSFMRVKDSNYEPRSWRLSDAKTFGTFMTSTPYVTTSKDDRIEDYEASKVMNRFNPKNDIVFHFSKDTPKIDELKKDEYRLHVDYRQVGRNCIKYWDHIFQMAGTGMHIRLDEEHDADLGELTTNQINIIDTISEDGLLGVGPSTADPETGEIISGVANVFVAGFRKDLTEQIRRYIRLRSGLITDYLFPATIQKRFPVMGYASHEIEQFCPAVVKFAESLQGRAQMSSTIENDYVKGCLERLLPRVLTEVTCHEMGHVFNLVHNFRCSSDSENSFKSYADMKTMYPKEKFKEVYNDFYNNEDPALFPHGSCVMDYYRFDRPLLVMPGRYDLAAIAFGYAGKVHVEEEGSSRWENMDLKKPLRDQTALVAKTHKYGFCDDGQAGYGDKLPSLDPLCLRHDYGDTPNEIMDSAFNSIRDEILLSYNKLDRAQLKPHTGTVAMGLEALERIYKLWRAHLTDFLGKEQANLHEFENDQVKYAKLQADLQTDFRHKEFLGVSERYYEYMNTIFTLPDLYCLAVRNGADKSQLNPKTDTRIIRFDVLQLEMKAFASKVVGCMDPSVNAYLKTQYEGKWTVISQIGHPGADIRYSTALEDWLDPKDIEGIAQTRYTAGESLFSPLNNRAGKRVHALADSTVSALDEPAIRSRMMRDLGKRYFEGLDLEGPVRATLEGQGYVLAPNSTFTPYKAFDASLNSYLMISVSFLKNWRAAEDVPKYVKEQSLDEVKVARSMHLKVRKDDEVYLFRPNSGRFYFASPSKQLPYRIISKMRELEEPTRFDIRSVDPEGQEGLYQLSEIIKHIPASAEDSTPLSFIELQKMLDFHSRIINGKSYALDDDTPMALEPALKTDEFLTFSKRLELLNQKLKALMDAAQRPVNEPITIPIGLDSETATITISPLEAKTTLEEIRSSTPSLIAWIKKEGFTAEELTQKGIVELWVNSRKNERLTQYWLKNLVPELGDRISFRTNSRLNYDSQYVALWNLLESLMVVDRELVL